MRRRYHYKEDDSWSRFITGIFGLYVLYLLVLWFTDKTKFLDWFIYGIVAVAVLIGGMVGFRKFRQKRKQDYLSSLLAQIREKGQGDYINNFINRFGHDGDRTRGKSFAFRNYYFEWERINDLEKVLGEKEVELQHNDKQKDIFTILRYYIQNKEENLTRESIKKEPQRFAVLSGPDFEKLLYRLFGAMGYQVQSIGKSGDQGGDLIINKDGERILIQAKCYRDWSTGNAAVQQVVGAMKYYDCNKAMVVTTSRFTVEAIALAKANNTELVPKERLQELLVQYLKESWS